MREILTTNGYTILVDDDVYDDAMKYKWRVRVRKNYLDVLTYKDGTRISYKRLILGTQPYKRTVSINGNSLDLRRENIRVFDDLSEFLTFLHQSLYKETFINVAKKNQGNINNRNKKSKYIGVCYIKRAKMVWEARINYKGDHYNLGGFMDEEDAAVIYDHKAYELYGPTAKVNFPNLTMEELAEKVNKINERKELIVKDMSLRRNQGRKRTPSASQYVGVSRRRDKWESKILYKGKRYYLGTYDSEKEAALAYDKKAIELHGERARLNFQ